MLQPASIMHMSAQYIVNINICNLYKCNYNSLNVSKDRYILIEQSPYLYVTGFGKRVSDFATLMSHNFVYDYTIILNFSPTLV